MSNFTQLIVRPIKESCAFNAVGNPIVYSLRREDYSFQQINDASGFSQIQINGTDVTAYFQVDDLIYVEGFGVATITASAFSTNTLLTLDIAYTSSDDGYVNNLSKRTDYSIEVEVFNAETGVSMGPRIVASPSQDGSAKFDISGIIKSFIYADWVEPVNSEVEEGTFIEVFIKYQEFYNDTYWELITDAANPITGVFAVMHLLQGATYRRYPHGGNMLLYCPADDTRKWMTPFVSPTMWLGWPFTLSFIWPPFIPSLIISSKHYDSEGTEIATDSAGVIFPLNKIHRVDLHDVLSNTALRVVSLSSEDVKVIEDIPMKVRQPCDNPVYLFWKNAMGGDTFWMFDESQDYEYNYPSGRKVKRLKLYADNLTVDEWEGINQLNSSTEVIANNIVDYNMDDSIDKTHFRNDNQVFIVNEDGTKTGIIVIANASETKSAYRKSAIEIEIELPEYFTV